MLLLIVVIVILLCIKISKQNIKIKGKLGEKLVKFTLEDIPGYKKVINNIYINDNGKSRQIDHILINQNGIFVIETKNYGGSIYGKEKSDNWYQYLNGKKYTFRNPIFQNYAHKKIISTIIGDKITITSIIAFTPRCKLNVISRGDVVLYNDKLIDYIKSQSIKLNNEQIDYYYNLIMENRITDNMTIEEHNANVRHYVEYKNKLANTGICPKCYGTLVQKNGKYGNFLACSNYPQCKFTKDIKK